jgi:ABC-type lipoprotein export system ATPase subunit
VGADVREQPAAGFVQPLPEASPTRAQRLGRPRRGRGVGPEPERAGRERERRRREQAERACAERPHRRQHGAQDDEGPGSHQRRRHRVGHATEGELEAVHDAVAGRARRAAAPQREGEEHPKRHEAKAEEVEVALLEDGQPRPPRRGGAAGADLLGLGAGRGHRDVGTISPPAPAPLLARRPPRHPQPGDVRAPDERVGTPDAGLTAPGYRGRVTVVAARGLVKSYGRGRAAHRVLDGADLTAHAGELVAVVGRSGSGKSTLLHLLGALDRADAGTIEITGERVDGRSERELTHVRRRRVGFVFQFFHLVPELTGEENVLLPARLPGSRADASDRGRALVARLGLRDVAGRLPHELSGGEQQRLAVARALVHDPPLVLADEPTGNLDPEAGATVLGLLRAAADEGRAVVLVTHDDAATAAADRVLHLEHGRLGP